MFALLLTGALALGVLAFGALAFGDPRNAVHVEPGSTVGALRLHAYREPDSVGGIATVTGIEVFRCNGGSLGAPVWRVERRRRWFGAPEAAVVRYADLPSGRWGTTHAAEPLDTGCYAVWAEGSAVLGSGAFRVLPSGAVVTLTRAEVQARRQHAPE